MARFSQRYGYKPIEDIIIRESMPKEIQNSICSAFDLLRKGFCSDPYYGSEKYMDMEEYLWFNFLNQRLGDFRDGSGYCIVATEVINDAGTQWYDKLDMLEMAIQYLIIKHKEGFRFHNLIIEIIRHINQEFERHNYAYRIVDGKVVELTTPEEIKSIETAIGQSKDNIKQHLAKALDDYSKRPEGNYPGSIKESISAVEALCRELTGESTLGKALNALEKKGLSIPQVLKDGFEKLYAYTNQPTTGIRHALMDTSTPYIPGKAEALYMLVTCSAFINYLRSKTQ